MNTAQYSNQNITESHKSIRKFKMLSISFKPYFRDMQAISCYVDNGFGTPMRASRTIKIERVPNIRVYPDSKTILKPVGAEVRIECEADAWPAPEIRIGKNNGDIVDPVETKTIGNGIFKTVLTIKDAEESDSGDYFCSAKNNHGSATEDNIKVVITNPTSKGKDMMQCCNDVGVRKNCLGTCTFNLDLDFLFFDAECIPDFDKVMGCGSGE